jgi:hypothetical protein
MSRTYRKTNLTETVAKQKYINDHISRLNIRYTIERVMYPHNEVVYAEALANYEQERRRHYRTCWQPVAFSQFVIYKWDYTNRIYHAVEYDYDEQVAKASKEYDSYKRDNSFYETSRNTQFKKHCAKDLRHKNKEVISKILKDDESWEQKPFPDTYIGKHYIWDYW